MAVESFFRLFYNIRNIVCLFEMGLSFTNECWRVLCIHALFKSINIKDVIFMGLEIFIRQLNMYSEY